MDRFDRLSISEDIICWWSQQHMFTLYLSWINFSWFHHLLKSQNLCHLVFYRGHTIPDPLFTYIAQRNFVWWYRLIQLSIIRNSFLNFFFVLNAKVNTTLYNYQLFFYFSFCRYSRDQHVGWLRLLICCCQVVWQIRIP